MIRDVFPRFTGVSSFSALEILSSESCFNPLREPSKLCEKRERMIQYMCGYIILGHETAASPMCMCICVVMMEAGFKRESDRSVGSERKREPGGEGERGAGGQSICLPVGEGDKKGGVFACSGTDFLFLTFFFSSLPAACFCVDVYLLSSSSSSVRSRPLTRGFADLSPCAL